MSSRRTCRLRSAERDDLVDADLVDELSKDDLVRAHLDWAPVRLEALKRLRAANLPWPEHWHWDWSQKAGMLDLLAYRCMGIEHGGRMQGLMMLSTVAVKGRLAQHLGKPALYVEFLETAPWNLRALTGTPQFLGVGVRLLEAAVVFSQQEGFSGRLGLHSLPQSEGFYRRYMTDLGLDPKHSQRLRYFEMHAQQGRYFLEGGKS